MEVLIAERHIHFTDYPFPGATVHPAGTLGPEVIRDADSTAVPPQIRTVLGETLFVPRALDTELARFCLRHDIPEVRRSDLWADLLEPFLDTEIDAESAGATFARLCAAGFSREEIEAVRERVGSLMYHYNFVAMVWEWGYLGLHDLLHAASGPLVAADVRAELGDVSAFYDWAMRIAERHP